MVFIIAKGMYNLSICISDATDNPVGVTVSHAKRVYVLPIKFKSVILFVGIGGGIRCTNRAE